MAKAGQIVIDIQAGTSRFIQDLEAAKGKVREFGGHTVSSMQASSAAIRTLEGNFTNNIRAVERFLTSVLPLGGVLRAAFPIVGAAAFAGLIVETTKRAVEFFKEMRDGPEKSAAAFRSLNNSVRLTNDELLVANDRLENDIAKLEGSRQNTLQVALDEARVAADKLADSLDRDLDRLHKVLDESNRSAWHSIFGVQDDLTKEIGGDSGVGGFRGRVASITDQGNAKIAAATNLKQKEAAQTALNTALQSAYNAEIQKLNDSLSARIEIQRELDETGTSDLRRVRGQTDIASPADVERQRAAIRQLRLEQAGIGLNARNQQLTERKEKDQAGVDNSKLDRPFDDRIKAINAQIEGARAKLNAIGQSEASQTLAKAFGESAKIIEEVNKALERHRTQLTEAQKAQIRSKELTLATVEADEAWRTKLEASTTSVNQRIQSLQLLTAAIGKGYEATRQANIETRVALELGEHANDPGFLKSHQSDVAGIRARAAAEIDAQHSNQAAAAIDRLNDQIELEKELARVQSEGAEAVRQAGLAVRLRQMTEAGATKGQIAAEIELDNARRANAIGEEVAKINQETEATERLAAATLKGADAVRKATLENKLAAIAREGDATIPGVIGIGQRGAAESGAAAATENQRLSKVAADADPFKRINEEVEDLQKARALLTDTLAIDIQLRDLENERLRILTEQTLKLRTAGAGVRAFFLEMQQDAKSTASIIYDALNSSLDKVADNSAKFLTGQKTNFGKAFQEIGESLVKDSIKSSLQKGLGELGKVFGIGKGKAAGKPGDSPANPIYAVIVGGPGSTVPGAGGKAGGILGQIPGVLGTASKGIGGFFKNLFSHGGGGIEDVTSDISFMADGGDADPGKVYGVAEKGEAELVSPKNSARITPLSKLGGGDTHIHYNVDARGAALGVENRIGRAIESSHHDSIAKGVRAQHERTQRTPQKR